MATFCTGCGHEVRPDLCFCTLRFHLARVTDERDALRAEVEAMRAVVEALAVLLDAGRDIVIKEGGIRHTRWVEDAFDALDALRARKVGE